jgi:hypothetical protein
MMSWTGHLRRVGSFSAVMACCGQRRIGNEKPTYQS